MRRADDEIAWEQALGHSDADEVRIVLLQEAVSAAARDGVVMVANADDARVLVLEMQVPGVEYDQIVELIEWSDKVVAW